MLHSQPTHECISVITGPFACCCLCVIHECGPNFALEPNPKTFPSVSVVIIVHYCPCSGVQFVFECPSVGVESAWRAIVRGLLY